MRRDKRAPLGLSEAQIESRKREILAAGHVVCFDCGQEMDLVEIAFSEIAGEACSVEDVVAMHCAGCPEPEPSA